MNTGSSGRIARAARSVVLAALTCLLVVGFVQPASAREKRAHTPQFALPHTDAASLHHLSRIADEEGLVPVIVALDVSTSAPGDLTPGELGAQRSAIAKARADLIHVLGGRALAGLKVSDDMPLIAFSATPEQLAALESSDLVAAVTQDHEFALDQPATGGKSHVPASPRKTDEVSVASDSTTEGTTSNGATNQLNPWWDWYQIGVDKARNAGYTGTGQTVAIIDSGVDATHPWLSGKVVAGACFVTGNGCPNGTSAQYGVAAAGPCTFALGCAHGTHVAHTAAGTWGVASGAKIIAVRAAHLGYDSNGNKAPYFSDSDLVWGLSYVYSLRNTYRIAAVNMSIGGGLYSGYCDNQVSDGTTNATYITGWINNLKSVGIATVVSSGNDNASTAVAHPACISNAISVGNTTYDAYGYDAVYGYTKYGSDSNATLDLLAPGTDICSAVPYWTDNDGTKDGVQCGWIGTSMAAPHVTGALAVLRQYRPYASVNTLVSALQRSGPGVYDSRNGITRTRINVWTALGLI